MCDPIGLLIYISMLLLLQVSVMKQNYFILFFAILFVIFISSFRGDAGVDSFLYTFRFDSMVSGFEGLKLIEPVEPILPLLMWFIKSLGFDFSIFSLFFGTIIGYIYFNILKNYPNAIYFGLTLFPVLFIDTLFNGVRIGLAYPLVFLSVLNSSISLFVIAFFTHISSIIVLPLILLYRKNKIKIIIPIISLIFFLSFINYEPIYNRFIVKFFQYQELYTRNFYSGIADSALLALAITIFLQSRGLKLKSLISIIPIIVGIVSILHFMFISNYVFLLRAVRLLAVIIFAYIAKSDQKINKFAITACLIFGIFYSLNFLRQINDSSGYEDNNGFLPLYPKIKNELFGNF